MHVGFTLVRAKLAELKVLPRISFYITELTFVRPNTKSPSRNPETRTVAVVAVAAVAAAVEVATEVEAVVVVAVIEMTGAVVVHEKGVIGLATGVVRGPLVGIKSSDLVGTNPKDSSWSDIKQVVRFERTDATAPFT